MRRTDRAELLAPAGSRECVRAAVNAGADAVYMGGRRFGARAYAESALSEEDELLWAIDYCHLHGVKIYITVNTLLKERELEELYQYMEPYALKGPDAVIVQDLGVLDFMRENFPRIPVHASTQMTVTGPYFANLLKERGVERVVAARELGLSEIREIKEKADVEIEAFVHGALCYCYSGQCLMSSVIGGRSGNRGRCAGPCRLPYEVYDENMRRLGRDDEKYVLSLKDLNTLPYIAKLLDAGVSSMKIEGRVKSPVYVAGVTSVYRKYLDRALDLREGRGDREPELLAIEERDRRTLSEIFDRGGDTAGYLFEHNGRGMAALYEKSRTRIPDGDIVGELTEKYLERDRKIPLKAFLRARKGERLSLRLLYDHRGLAAEAGARSEHRAEQARSGGVSPEELRAKVSKLGNTEFFIESLDMDVEEGIFIPLKEINAVRREACDELEKKVLSGRRGDS